MIAIHWKVDWNHIHQQFSFRKRPKWHSGVLISAFGPILSPWQLWRPKQLLLFLSLHLSWVQIMHIKVVLAPIYFQTFQHPCLGFSAEINSEEWPLGSLWVTPAAAIVKMQNCLLPKCKWEERVPYNNNQLVRHRRPFCCCLSLLFVVVV